MNNDYLIVHKKILPEYLEKVIQARELLERHECATITEAVQRTGISRNTYYKYKDYVYAENSGTARRNAVISVILKDEKGSLSSLINEITRMHISILTISQAIPISGRANVLMSLDISAMECTMDELLAAMKTIPSVRKAHLDAME